MVKYKQTPRSGVRQKQVLKTLRSCRTSPAELFQSHFRHAIEEERTEFLRDIMLFTYARGIAPTKIPAANAVGIENRETSGAQCRAYLFAETTDMHSHRRPLAVALLEGIPVVRLSLCIRNDGLPFMQIQSSYDLRYGPLLDPQLQHRLNEEGAGIELPHREPHMPPWGLQLHREEYLARVLAVGWQLF